MIIDGTDEILVPLNNTTTILYLIKLECNVIIVFRHCLDDINCTLLTLNLLKKKEFKIAVLFSGNEHKTTEVIIKKITGPYVIGKIDEKAYFDKNVIKKYAEKLKEKL